MTKHEQASGTLNAANFRTAIINSLSRMTFRYQVRNPVMFIVFIAAIFTTMIFVVNMEAPTKEPSWFIGQIAFWLWFTVIFANFAEAIAESKGKAQAETLKKSRREITAKKQYNARKY